MIKLGKYKDCNIINDWIKSITNHMYWCAASTPENDCEQMAIRWKSLNDHICDNHEECYHDPLGDLERRKKWFIPGKIYRYTCTCSHICAYIYSGTKACEKLYDVICNKNLLTDIKQLSPFQQTSGLESYHSVINHFAPKLLAFSYVGMHCRYILHPCTYDSIL